ncbi:MAG: uncharacterized UPF0160 family protein [Flavobacteriaceae bacterium]|jgi:uncharacterized UPF0160 family protein
MKKLVTHNGNFHSDDVFACAILSLVYKKENIEWQVTRTRDPKLIEEADVVFDVGGIYDASLDRFDHHQKGGAGERENGIPYASCGLVWKKYGPELVEGTLIQYIDEKICQPIDAVDNGYDISKTLVDGIYPYSFQSIVGAYRPTWKEDIQGEDDNFLALVELAEGILSREIITATDRAEARTKIEKAYEEAEDKRIILLEEGFTRDAILPVLSEYPEPVYFVYPKSMGHWKAEVVRKSMDSFEARRDFPESWAGVRDEELAEMTGVSDAYFCHNGRFLIVAKSKEGALELAQKALEI